MSETVRRLGQISREYEVKAGEYEALAIAAARADAAYKVGKARHMARLKAEDPKASQSWADTLADADSDIAVLLEERFITAAVVDAAAKKLAQLKEAVAVGRSVVASEREADRQHAAGIGGQA